MSKSRAEHGNQNFIEHSLTTPRAGCGCDGCQAGTDASKRYSLVSLRQHVRQAFILVGRAVTRIYLIDEGESHAIIPPEKIFDRCPPIRYPNSLFISIGRLLARLIAAFDSIAID